MRASAKLLGAARRTAPETQVEPYRQLTSEQRLAVALELHEKSCDMAREGIRRQHPAADAAETAAWTGDHRRRHPTPFTQRFRNAGTV